MIILMIFFQVFIVIVLLGLTDAEIQHYNTNIIFAIAEKLLGKTWGYVAIIAVLLSTVGTVETQMLQFTRTMFAKGRDGALEPAVFPAAPAVEHALPGHHLHLDRGLGACSSCRRTSTASTTSCAARSPRSASRSRSTWGSRDSPAPGTTGGCSAASSCQAITHVIWPAVSAGVPLLHRRLQHPDLRRADQRRRHRRHRGRAGAPGA